MSHRSQCNRADFPNSQIPRNPGGIEHVQTVRTKLFFSAYAQEAHTEANYRASQASAVMGKLQRRDDYLTR